ncbi:PepSY domain-containing protein [Janthinobacterium sp. RB2R34]|uniref:PepSY domain-containing protein n=1 Tax=Janthinobacterium sp. RB2R34 TaxID=3424193 RepID=UPI003F2270AF
MTTFTLKRLLYQLHRWTGIAACVLMLLWFISGMVMLFVGYPKLTPWERLGALPQLQLAGCCQPLAQVDVPPDAREIVLTTVAGAPVWKVRDVGGRLRLFDAVHDQRLPSASRDTALASARAFLPGAASQYLDLVQEDRWTHSRSLDVHRPLHQVQMDDGAQTLLYLSSATGEVVLDAPREQRLWNFIGAWLHWVYPLRYHSTDPVWSWIVIIASALATFTALTGTVAGIWRWRFKGRYKSGARTPYRESWMRWHHVTGLLFAGFVCAWIFSGLMSMNPLRIFDPHGQRPDLAAWQGGTPATVRLGITPPQALNLLEQQGFHAVELEWRVLDKQPYLLARDGAARTRLLMRQQGQLVVREQWPQQQLLQAADKLMPGMVAGALWLTAYDAYYYGREPEAMMGASERRLPVLRVRFNDPQANWVYLDPYAGTVALGVDRRQRVSRWLFSFLHSWDLPPLLRAGPWREGALILLSVGGAVLSGTGIVIGWRRLRLWWRARQSRREPV